MLSHQFTVSAWVLAHRLLAQQRVHARHLLRHALPPLFEQLGHPPLLLALLVKRLSMGVLLPTARLFIMYIPVCSEARPGWQGVPCV